ncbi:inactive polyglycylase TTLL10 [Sorex araneus]|uniref:inactive polyglycylase TTLL10 n=1 Tax=Sorex araneus TaxID=42254 RepID=UPI0003314C15|nr:inactive polyglycylase TTLL10 [Sorex araneus]
METAVRPLTNEQQRLSGTRRLRPCMLGTEVLGREPLLWRILSGQAGRCPGAFSSSGRGATSCRPFYLSRALPTRHSDHGLLAAGAAEAPGSVTQAAAATATADSAAARETDPMRGPESRTRRVQPCHRPPRAPAGAHEKSMGSSNEEPLHQLRPLEHDADAPDNTEAAEPPATLLDGQVPTEEKPLPRPEQGPFFYIGGSNGAAIISSYCKGKGWRRTQDSHREDYMLKWCEVKSRANYCSFREGKQLLYQLPNNKLLTTKIGLLSVLREYSRNNKTPPGTQTRDLRMEDFFPETYRLDIKEEREAFFTLFDDSQMWICKPTASNQGKGIFLLRSQEEVAALQAKTQSAEEDPVFRKTPIRMPQARVVQRYIQNPLLLDGKKFDVRSYLLIACTVPYMVFFGHGYARLTLNLYDPHSRDLSGHLTNQFMQKKSPLYVMFKEETVWSMEHLNRYINDKFRKAKGLPRDWVFTTFTRRMQQIMVHCFLAVRSKLECKLGYFDLIGCDFLIDENFKVWLLEMNSNPALHTNCEVLKNVIPAVVMETLDLALETFQKSLNSQRMRPLLSQRHFVLLHNGEMDLWPRLWGSRGVPRLLPSFVPPSLCASDPDRLARRRPAPPRRPPSPVPSPDLMPGHECERSPDCDLSQDKLLSGGVAAVLLGFEAYLHQAASGPRTGCGFQSSWSSSRTDGAFRGTEGAAPGGYPA